MRQRCLDLNIKYSALLMTVCLLLACSFFMYILLCGEYLGWYQSILHKNIRCLQILCHTKEQTYNISFKPKHTTSKLLSSVDITKIKLSCMK